MQGAQGIKMRFNSLAAACVAVALVGVGSAQAAVHKITGVFNVGDETTISLVNYEWWTTFQGTIEFEGGAVTHAKSTSSAFRRLQPTGTSDIVFIPVGGSCEADVGFNCSYAGPGGLSVASASVGFITPYLHGLPEIGGPYPDGRGKIIGTPVVTKFAFNFGTFDTPISYEIAYTVDAPVPEPGTWALMIGGFGAIGGMMRRRRVAVVAQ